MKNGDAYAVNLLKDNIPGILQSAEVLKPGEEVLAEIVSVERKRLTLRQKTAGQNKPKTATPQPALVAEFRRIIDLIPQPPSVPRFQMNTQQAIDALFQKIEQSSMTTCLKGTCEESKSRFVMLILKGRIVGCTFGRRGKDHSALSVTDAARLVMQELLTHNVQLACYDTPEHIMMPLSALYMGEPIEFAAVDALATLGAIQQHFMTRLLTGAIVLSNPKSGQPTYFGYVKQGAYVGGYDVAKQEFSPHTDGLLNHAAMAPTERLRASILNPEATVFGFAPSSLKV